MLKNLVLIFIGGGVGSIMRYLVSFFSHKFINIGGFPFGTLIVNVIGCFLIGLLTSQITKLDDSLRLLLVTGFCGGFTTFSAFSSESIALYQNENYFLMILYIVMSIILGLSAVLIGNYLIKM